MNTTQIKATLEAFVARILDESAASIDAAELARALDTVAYAVSQLDMVGDEFPYRDTPDGDETALRVAIARRFPSLGLYNMVADISENIGETACVIGDAIDDMVDITREIQSALWRFAHTSEADATWHLVFSYRMHWGHHLRHLQLYLQDSC